MKKKIDVITLQAVQNYGSVLQAYATQRTLEKFDCNVRIINYVRDVVKYENLLKVRGEGNIIKELALTPTIERWKIVFQGFCNKNLNLTDKVYSCIDDFKDYDSDADAFCTGSDQVWNSTWNNGILPELYLSFISQEKYKFALSASFGNELLSNDEIQNTEKLIKQYRHISVREKSGLKILKEQYHYNQGVQLLDPTLSLRKEEWQEIATPSKIKGDYILIYNLNRNAKFDRYAANLAKKSGCKLVRLCIRYDQILRNGKSVLIPTINEFIGLIDGAKYVLTDSFHATAFSMNLNTTPVCIYPKNFSGRIASFLELVGCEQQHAKSFEDLDILNNVVDFDRVNSILDRERSSFMEFVDMVMNEIEQRRIEENGK